MDQPDNNNIPIPPIENPMAPQTENPVVPPVETTSVPENLVTPPNSSKKVSPLVIGMGLLLTILLLIVGLLAYQNSKLQGEMDSLRTANAETESKKMEPAEPTPTETPDPTADWETYTGNGITFKYPPEWNASDYEITTTYDLEGIVRLQPLTPDVDIFAYMDLSIWENPNNLSLKEYDEQIIQSEFSPNRLNQPDAKEVKLDVFTAYKTEDFNCEPHNCDMYVIPLEGQILEIHSYTDYVTDKVFDQILSTFEFTE